MTDRRAHWYTLVVLMIYEFACGVDMSQTSVLVKPIEQTYGIGDAEFAAVAVSSIAFGATLIYYVGGVLADTFNRRNILVVSCLLWSLAGFGVLFAAHTWQLFAARFATGLAMSIGGASIFHILVDSFTRERRTIAICLFGAGVSIGNGFGLSFTGIVLGLAERIGTRTVPLAGIVRPWQLCFALIGVLGIGICALLLTLREPSRLDVRAASRKPDALASVRAFLTYLRRHGLFWVTFLAANAAVYSVRQALVNWEPTLGGRAYHVSVAAAAAALGAIVAATEIAGRLVGGSIAQALVNRGRGSDLPRIMAYFPATAALFAIAFPLVPSYAVCLAFVAIVLFLAGVVGAFEVNAVQDTVPNESRGQILGVFSLFDFASRTIGSVGIALVSDRLFGGGAGLRDAFALLGGLCCAASALAFAVAVPGYLRARAEIEAAPVPLPIADVA